MVRSTVRVRTYLPLSFKSPVFGFLFADLKLVKNEYIVLNFNKLRLFITIIKTLDVSFICMRTWCIFLNAADVNINNRKIFSLYFLLLLYAQSIINMLIKDSIETSRARKFRFPLTHRVRISVATLSNSTSGSI